MNFNPNTTPYFGPIPSRDFITENTFQPIPPGVSNPHYDRFRNRDPTDGMSWLPDVYFLIYTFS